jgi:hypothetical protein
MSSMQDQMLDVLSSQQDAAAGGWFDCEVDYVGPADDGVIYIRLREGNGAFDRWFKACDSHKREMLATAFTAITTGLRVKAALDTTDEYGTIMRLSVYRL